MDLKRLFDLLNTGLDLIREGAQQGTDINDAVVALKNIVSKRPEDVTDKDLDEVERKLDAKQEAFEKPMRRIPASEK